MADAIIHYLVVFAIGAALDWASFAQMQNAFGTVGIDATSERYTDHLFPRICLSIAGLAIIAVSTRVPDGHLLWSLVGAAIFLASSLYGAFRMLRGTRE